MTTIDATAPDSFRYYGIVLVKREEEWLQCVLKGEGFDLLAGFLGVEGVVCGTRGVRLPAGPILPMLEKASHVAWARCFNKLGDDCCPYALRSLYDVSREGAQVLGESLGLQALFLRPPAGGGWPENEDFPAVGSLMLSRGGFWWDLAFYLLWHREGADRIYREGNLLHGYSAVEVPRFVRASGAAVTLLRRVVVEVDPQ